MNLGVSSIVEFRNGVKAALTFAYNNGFDHVSIFLSPPHFPILADNSFIASLKKYISTLGINVSLKAPGFTLNIASLDETIADLSLRKHREIIKLANMIDSEFVIIRAGMIFYPEKTYYNVALKTAIDRLNQLIEFSIAHGVKLAIENYPYDFDLVRTIQDLIFLKKNLSKVEIALNIAHIYESTRSLAHYNLARITRVIDIIGPPPSPYHVPYHESRIPNLILFYRDFIKHAPKRIIIASIRKRIVLKLKDLISESL